jgi:ABC-type glycerol-3-phosphate transport system substrate-binding protein
MATMKSTLAMAIAALVAALPLAAAAQSPSPNTGDFELQRKHKRPVVLPKPTPDQVRADADAAISEYAARNPGAVVRETSPVRPSRRPDLDYDVKTGIQAERLKDALRIR